MTVVTRGARATAAPSAAHRPASTTRSRRPRSRRRRSSRATRRGCSTSSPAARSTDHALHRAARAAPRRATCSSPTTPACARRGCAAGATTVARPRSCSSSASTPTASPRWCARGGGCATARASRSATRCASPWPGAAPGHAGARVVAPRGRRRRRGGDRQRSARRRCRPYIRTPLHDPQPLPDDVRRPATPASAAAPTAGLHFTARVRDALAARGVGWATLQLDVGLGTFAPITAADVRGHRMHAERCTLPARDGGAHRGGARAPAGASSRWAPRWCARSSSHVDDGGALRAGHA